MGFFETVRNDFSPLRSKSRLYESAYPEKHGLRSAQRARYTLQDGVRMCQGLTFGYNSNFLAEGAKFAGASFVTIRASNVAGC